MPKNLTVRPPQDRIEANRNKAKAVRTLVAILKAYPMLVDRLSGIETKTDGNLHFFLGDQLSDQAVVASNDLNEIEALSLRFSVGGKNA